MAIQRDLSGYTVWFLTGSQGLYGPGTLRQVAEQSRSIARQLDGSPDVSVRVEWKAVLTDTDGIRRAALEANSDDSVIGVIAWMHTFSPAKMWITGLQALDKPLLHLHTQANLALPWSTIDFDFMNLNQAAHGDRSSATSSPGSTSPARRWSGTCRIPASPGRWEPGYAPPPAGRRRRP
jgi:L-arabinose isomerase